MTELQETISARLAKLSNDYLAGLPLEINELSVLAQALVDQVDARPLLVDIHRRLHKLAGSGGTFGLHDLSRAAAALEASTQIWLAADFSTSDAVQRCRFADAIAALGVTIGLREPIRSTLHADNAPTDVDARTQVWLVEDDVLLGETLTRLLSQFGYDVRHFARIDSAEAAARTERPDMLIMDVMFSDEGINATEELLERPAFLAMGCPLLFISAHGDFQSRVRAARLGAKGFMMKPVDVPRLVDRLEHILETRFATPYRVLIVDDDIALSQHFHLVLSAADMEVAVLNQPQDIIETVSAFHPELVLMDIHMPGYSGLDLATVIRHYDEWIGLPIVYLSTETDRDVQLQAMGRGADDFLTKPITDAHLVAAVRVRAARSRQLSDLMSKDSLTGLLKHARIKETIALELVRSQRSGKPLSVAMLDVDHFKSVNDNYGHAVGDRVLKSLAHLMKQRLRKADGIGRYGGEEFVAILPECAQDVARQVLDDIRLRFAALRFQHDGREFSVTLSAGIACTAESPQASGDDLLIAADTALYAAKHGGRNQVRLAGAVVENVSEFGIRLPT
ncbi:MAG: diguanylate cyclase [Rhodoferax sp.]|nr:diguanylate cyclase [Rhodoferax sp.]